MAYTDREDLNYLGMLYAVGANQTPFLNMIGGLNQGKTSRSFLFPVAQPYDVGSAAQPAITEAASVSSNTATTVTRGQDTNTAQIFQYTVEVSHAKQSTTGEFGGIQVIGDQPVQDELDFQAQSQLIKMAKDLDYSMLQGAYQAGSDATTAAKMRGLKNAISTNEVAAAGATLSKALMDAAFAKQAAQGAPFSTTVVLCNAFQKQQLSDAYGYAPEDRNIGGVNVKQIEMDFGTVGVMFDPNMPTDEVYIVELDYCMPVFVPYNGMLVTYEDLAQVAASKKAQWYAQIGLDYGLEEHHAKVTGLATS